MKINECESLHELPITPQVLRDIAAEMEQKGKNEFFQHGQVVRYKFSHLFSFVYKPEKTIMRAALLENEYEVSMDDLI